jgi:nucleotide-binding universal stress UspA family protein
VAASIAKRTDSRLILMHIINIPSYESNMSFSEFQDVAEGLFIMKLVRKRFEELMSKPFLEGVNVLELVQFDTVYESIAKQAKEQQANLIVMGSHGASGAKEFLMGSNTQKIIRTSTVPVLVVKERTENFNVKKILFASNFYTESYGSFHGIRDFVKLFNAELHLLKVITPSVFESTKYSKRLIDDFAKKFSLSGFQSHIYNEERIEEGIHAVAEEIGADLIAMETHGRTGFAQFLAGSITESVANHSKLPVLSVKITDMPADENVIFPE